MACMLSARDDKDASAVDWWFIYKLPEGVGKPRSQGYEYLYFDPSSQALERSAKLLNIGKEDSALDATLSGVFSPGSSSVSWVLYNDEHPQPERDNGEKGHCKGVLAFDHEANRGLLLIHSTPRFPKAGEGTLPDDERIYGQTYLCITLKDYKTANAIAQQLRLEQQPQVYAHHLAEGVPEEDAVSLFARDVPADTTKMTAALRFESAEGKEFRLIAKNRHWGGDFWIDLVAPELGAEMKVESWRRGTVPPEEKTKDPDEVEDVLYIDLAPIGLTGISWHYTKDHAKWGVSADGKKPWVCVGDLNRMVSQEKRGGGTAAFLQPDLHAALDQIERLGPPPSDKS